MKKLLIAFSILLVTATQVTAGWVYNPFTGKLDFSGGSAGVNPFAAGGGTATSPSLGCNTGSITLSSGTFTYPGGTVAAAASPSQEFTIITGLTGAAKYEHVYISEHTQFTQGASVTLLKASMGRPGLTNDEMLAQFPLMQSSGDVWFSYDRPAPPLLTGSYTLVIALRTTGGNVSALTAGQINYEVCGYAN